MDADDVDDAAIKGAVTALIDNLVMTAEAEEWRDADTFIALTTNAETKSLSFDGPFGDVAGALEWAAQHEKDLNVGMPESEDPFVVRVYPMREPS